VLPVASAACFILSFPNFNLGFCGWFFLVPLLIGVGLGGPWGILGAYIAGVLSWLGTIYWLTNVSVAGYIGLCIYLGLYWWIFGFVIARFIERGKSIIFWAPVFWVVAEFVRGKLITGFPWALAGASQIVYPQLCQIAATTGVWGVSFVVVLLNAFIYENLYAGVVRKEGMKSLKMTLLAMSVVAYVYFSGTQELKPGKGTVEQMPFRISIVQPGIEQDQKWDKRCRDLIFGRFRYLTNELKKEKPQLVIWPESCVPGELRYDRDIYDLVHNLCRAVDAPILLGSQDIEFGDEKKFYNAAVLIHPKFKYLGQYNKLHLVPFGEYVPLRDHLPFLRKLTPIEADFAPGNDSTTFGLPQQTMRFKGDKGELISHTRMVRFGVVICFEDIFPDLVRKFTQHDVDFIVNLTNDAWFGRTGAPFQHAALAAFRAIENRTFMVRSTNTGYSCVIDPYGRVVADVRDAKGETIFTSGHVTFDLKAVNKLTIYKRYGDIFAGICFVFAAIGLLLVWKKKE